VRRREILRIVEASPGLCLRELAERVGVTRNAVLYHVRRLEEQGRVVTVRQGRSQRHFPPRTDLGPREQDLVGLLRTTPRRAVLEELRNDPTVSWRKLAARLGLSRTALRWHIAQLEKADVIRTRVHHASRGYEVEITKRAAQAIEAAYHVVGDGAARHNPPGP
jgi:predicted transcriptional regulator